MFAIWLRGDEDPISWKFLLSILIIVFAMDLYGEMHWKQKGFEQGRLESTGMPSTNLVGRTFVPLAFVVTERHTLVYDKDEKVYALDGIKLEDGLKPETLTVGTNISYTVYTKAGQLYFGRLETPKPEKL